MIPEYEIICIQRPNGYLQRISEKISDIGYKTTSGIAIIPIKKAIEMIRNKECCFYVSDNGHRMNVHIVTRGWLFQTPYLRTKANGEETDNLENLPKCA